jgi:hypothetical protein
MHLNRQEEFKDFSQESLANMKKYLIFSQVLDWGLQNYIDNFCRIIKDICLGNSQCNFPFEKLLEFVNSAGIRRKTSITSGDFSSSSYWFGLKIITPNKPFNFVKDPEERFNPEIDHIFPETPAIAPLPPEKYFKFNQDLWNLQPVKGEINAYKLNTPPRNFFMQYSKYLKDYDFLPTVDLTDKIWLMENASVFIQMRKKQIVSWIKQYYDIDIIPDLHAYYTFSENGFHPAIGTFEEQIQLYDPVAIVKFLESKGIAPSDQIIDGWSKDHQKLYETALSERST